MKYRILFDNYYVFFIIFAIASIFKYLLFGKNDFFQLIIILSVIWLYDLLSEKRMYLSNFKMDENIIELKYINRFLKEKEIRLERQNLTSINYIKNTWFLNKFDCLQIIEKDNSKALSFKIVDKNIQEDVQKIISENKSYC